MRRDLKNKILIVGGGACGLMAAMELLAKGYEVTLLESRNRLGGRIWSLDAKSARFKIEAGAEFIHGDLPLTLSLLKNLGIDIKKTGGKMVVIPQKGEEKSRDGINWELLFKKMGKLKKDMPLSTFLSTYFPDESNKQLRNYAIGFAGGYDLADPKKASTLALWEEWNSPEGDQFRIEGGYASLIAAMEAHCLREGCSIHLSEAVTNIRWKKGEVKARTAGERILEAGKLITTLPVGLWHRDPVPVRFSPGIPEKVRAYRQIGYGPVIKIILIFKRNFWKEKYGNAGFFLTGQAIPTWWTQFPIALPMLTGWLGGPAAKKINDLSQKEILNIALASLSTAFELDQKKLNILLAESFIYDWQQDEFSAGGYSYSMVGSQKAKTELGRPVERTLYFAGEALYAGTLQGTVEAALESGREVARKIPGTSHN